MKHCFHAVFLAVFLVSCTNEELVKVTPEEPVVEVVADAEAYVPGEAYVYFSEEMTELIEGDLASGAVRTKSADLNATLDALGITEMRRLFPDAGEYEPRTRREGLHRWYIVKYSNAVPMTRAQDSFLSVSGVEYIEPVRQIKINDFNDPDFSKLWGLDNKGNPGYDINVLPVWDNYTTGNPDVIVSVVDSGVDFKHEDLAANCVSSDMHFDAVTQTFGGTRITPEDHGTHVAGTIAAVSNNRKGIAGIAGGDHANGKKGVRIMSCQIFKGDQSGSSAAAIKAGADMGAVISQNSWGYIYDVDGDGVLNAAEKEVAKASQVSEADKAAINYFIRYAGCDNDGNQLPNSPMKGGVVIFAAGNDGYTNAAPGNYAPVIAVGAIDNSGNRASFSNYGDWVDIAAPGAGIYSTIPGNAYDYMNGTSMACPHVSGVAALIVSQFGGVGFTNEMLEDRLINSSNKEKVLPSDKIGGLVDAYGAMVYGKVVDVEPVTDLEARGRSNNIDLTWTAVKDSENEAAYGYLIIYGKDKAAVESATYSDHKGMNFLTYSPRTAAGRKVEFTVGKLEFNTDYFVKVFAYSYGLNYSEPTAVVEAATTVNNAPEITTTYTGSYDLKASQTINVPIAIKDNDGHEVTVSYKNGSSADSFKSVPGGGWQITVVGNAADEGTYTAEVMATDEYGLSATMKITYRILPNMAPVKLKEINNFILSAKGEEFSFNMSEYVSEPDGDDVKYEITISDEMIVHAFTRKGNLVGIALNHGAAEVQVKAVDPKGAAAVFNFKVLVKNPSDPISVYPTTVTDHVNIAILEESENTHISIYSQTGQAVYDSTSTMSGFEPVKIDIASCPPGMYVVSVAFGGNEYKKNIIKL